MVMIAKDKIFSGQSHFSEWHGTFREKNSSNLQSSSILQKLPRNYAGGRERGGAFKERWGGRQKDRGTCRVTKSRNENMWTTTTQHTKATIRESLWKQITKASFAYFAWNFMVSHSFLPPSMSYARKPFCAAYCSVFEFCVTAELQLWWFRNRWWSLLVLHREPLGHVLSLPSAPPGTPYLQQ